uniref:Sex-determining region Y protein n=1 Tax=Syphacia muris TaxID=451379 RepID=A0A0N5AMC3_9BILA
MNLCQCEVWSQERRAQIANSESKMHNSQISKELGAEWRKMSAEKKAPYIRRAKELRDELLRQHPDYVYRPKRKPRPQPKTVSNNHSISPSSASAAAAAVKQHMQRSATDGQIPTATAAQFLLATEAQKQQSMMLACQLQTQLFASFLKESQQKKDAETRICQMKSETEVYSGRKDLLNAAVKQCPAAALPTSLASTGNSQTLGQYLPSDLNLLSTLSSMNAQLHPAFLLNKFAQSQLPQLQSFADVNSQ